MKQGRASHSNVASTKREPIAHAVEPCAVADIGLQHVYTAPPEPLYAGRGYEAPAISSETHHCGSQGKH